MISIPGICTAIVSVGLYPSGGERPTFCHCTQRSAAAAAAAARSPELMESEGSVASSHGDKMDSAFGTHPDSLDNKDDGEGDDGEEVEMELESDGDEDLKPSLDAIDDGEMRVVNRSTHMFENNFPQCKDGELQTRGKYCLSGVHTPQRRPWSPSSPSNAIENSNKKSAIPCNFFLKGRCTKGKNCSFLHREASVSVGIEDTKDPSEGYRIGGLKYDKVSKVETMIKTSSDDPLALGAVMCSSKLKSQFHMQRELVRAYGGAGLGPSACPTAGNGYLGRDFSIGRCVSYTDPAQKLWQVSLFSDGIAGVGTSCYEGEHGDDKHLSSRLFSDRKFLSEANLQEGLPRMGNLNYQPFFRKPFLMKDTVLPDHRFQDHQISSAVHNPRSLLYSGGSSWSSSFLNPIHPGKAFSSVSKFLNSENSSRGSTPFISDYVDLSTAVTTESGLNCSRSASLPKNPSTQNTQQNNISEDLPGSAKRITYGAGDWELSVAFQSPFCSALPIISPSGNQYDPLVDSFDHQKTQTTNSPQLQKPSILPTVSNNIVNVDDHSAVDDQSGNLKKFSDLDGMSEKNGSGIDGPKSKVKLGIDASDGKESPVKEERTLDSCSANANDNTKNDTNQGTPSKDSRVLRIFHAALVDFLKELIKPSWKEARLSKDDHKAIIKKAVYKVLSTLPTHQIPSNAEAIKQYLSYSRTKLLKLVEGYVEKYSKDRKTVS